MKKTLYPITNTGSVSLLMIFIVLCLTILSTLSLSGALGEYQYSQKIAQHHADYYRASGSASRMLRNGVPLPVISEALGDSSPDSTMRYLSTDSKTMAMCTLPLPKGVRP